MGVDAVPPHGSVVLRRDRFYGPSGNTLASFKTGALRVQLQTGNDFTEVGAVPSEPVGTA